MKKILFLTFIILLIIPFTFAWYDTDKGNCRDINITNPSSVIELNYVAYINFTNTTHMNLDLSDIIFINGSCKDGTSILAHEIEPNATNMINIFLTIPVLPVDGFTTGMLYNDSGSSHTQNSHNVWLDDDIIWHMDDLTSSIVEDSTANGNNGTKASAHNPTQVATGFIGFAQEYNGHEEIYATGTGKSSATNNWTISAWADADVTEGYMTILGFNDADNGGTIRILQHDGLANWAMISVIGNMESTFPKDTAWHQHVAVSDGTRIWYYIDGYLDANFPMAATSSASNPVLIAGYLTENTWFWRGRIDEVRLTYTNMTPERINLTYQNIANPERIIVIGDEQTYMPPNVYNITLILKDQVGTVLTTLDESDIFFINTNFTRDDVVVTDAICNVTTGNISGIFFLEQSNYTFTNTTQELLLNVDEGNIGIVNDVFVFDVCKENVATGIDLYINGGLHLTVDPSALPLCGVGVLRVQNITEDFNGVTLDNMSLKCSGCTSSQRQVRVVQIEESNSLLAALRNFDAHFEEMPFNISTNLYSFGEHPYRFRTGGINAGNITVFCNDNRTEFLFNITEINLTIDILSLGDVAFTDGMVIESSQSNILTISVTGDEIQSIEINLTYANGSVIKTSSTTFMNITPLNVFPDGTYNFTITAIDNDNTAVVKYAYFLSNDTVSPLVTQVNIIPTVPLLGNLLNCSAYVEDPTHTNLNLSFEWFEDDVLNVSYSVNVSTTSYTTTYTTILINSTLSTWTCRVRAFNGAEYGAYLNTSVTVTKPLYEFDCHYNPSPYIKLIDKIEWLCLIEKKSEATNPNTAIMDCQYNPTPYIKLTERIEWLCSINQTG